jgi:hypothetical protein
MANLTGLRTHNAACVGTGHLGQRCGFDKGSISVSVGVLRVPESHPCPLLSINYGLWDPCHSRNL